MLGFDQSKEYEAVMKKHLIYTLSPAWDKVDLPFSPVENFMCKRYAPCSDTGYGDKIISK